MRPLSPENHEILEYLIELEAKDDLKGCFDNIPIEVYHHPECPGYSSTMLKRIVAQSYNHWFCEKDESSRNLEFGSAFHCWVNEPHLFARLFKVVQTDARNTSEWRSARKAYPDVTLLTRKDFNCIQIMAKKLYQHPGIAPYLKDATFEHTYFSKDAATGLWKRCRLDIYSHLIPFDLKATFDGSDEEFSRQMRNYLQRVSSAYYLEILSEVTGTRHEDFRLVACEYEEPHEINVMQVSPLSIQRGQAEIRAALGTIRRILDDGPSAWRGYQLELRQIYI